MLAWLEKPIKIIDQQMIDDAKEHQMSLTKPPGALGQLEDVAIRMAAIQGNNEPECDYIKTIVFASDHGVVAENISAFPQIVTVEMIKNFSHGGAAINVLCDYIESDLQVINVGTVTEMDPLPTVLDQRVGAGTANFCQQPAMTEKQLDDALNVGRLSVQSLFLNPLDLFIGGEMGIGNTTSAAAIICAILNEPATNIAGKGTGLEAAAVKHKCDVIEQALLKHRDSMKSPLDVLRCLGGFEIAALTGAYISCAQQGIPMLIDGFICSAAALIATELYPDSLEWMFFSHTSAEKGHQLLMQRMSVTPLLSLGLRLGEGSGAATAVPLIRMACKLHGQMATFDSANVSNQTD
ncbi:MAG: nicotinate-nucleotide--dimethylbenzimidazole phosphoribosyltransferase [Methylococcales bacterium]|jgi:nicotinate-nucleotide--dimethylbenzimidazole phosphoribosyltransferase|nr:nicotinate-nucleotide--dimethylbenzimidazole phosphoribosyltransferase [Methylococcales bacterium]MBT7410292.1 nicotinate-nucleotide--dimethylbenzimidazole phosphoribosyltransferase [Methylococcales bacterium]